MKKAGIILKMSNCQNSFTKALAKEKNVKTKRQISINFLRLKFAQSKGTIGAQKLSRAQKHLRSNPHQKYSHENFQILQE